jgi:hypothetical protein
MGSHLLKEKEGGKKGKNSSASKCWYPVWVVTCSKKKKGEKKGKNSSASKCLYL